MNKPFAFIDLDNTIFARKSKHDNEQDLVVAALNRENKPFSYMNKEQQHFFQWLNQSTVIIPTTARDVDSYNRVVIKEQFQSYKILNFGATILDENNQIDKKWQKHIFDLMDNDIQIILNIYNELILKLSSMRIELVTEEDSNAPIFILIKDKNNHIQNIENVFYQLKNVYANHNLAIHYNGNNLTISSKYLDKKYAVEYIINNEKPIFTLGFGDSISDVNFMNSCLFSCIPKNSQIAEIINKNQY